MTAKVSELIARVKSRISLPDNDDRFGPSELVDVMNEVMEESVLPELMKYNEEYLVVKKVVPLTSNSTVLYPDLLIPVPQRTYGLTLRDLKYRNLNDDSFNGLVNIPYISPEDKELFNTSWTEGIQNSTLGFYFQGAAVQLIGNADSLTGELIFTYVIKPSTLVNNDTLYASVTNITFSTPTLTFTATSAGSQFDAAVPTANTRLVDIYHTASGHLLAADVKVTRSGSSFTTTELSDNDRLQLAAYQAGGFPISGSTYSSQLYIVPAGQNQYSTLPKEYDNILIYYTCQRVLESLGDTEGLAVNQQQLERAQNSIQSAYGKRIAGENKKVTNRRGLLSHLTGRGLTNRWRTR